MRSMTGYSKEYFENEKYAISLEIKSVNNKNLNLKIKSPHMLNFLENKIRTE
ncbi:MAG: YicC/YloC family endoribonuclease, partial [Cetobacterium sp.]